MKKLVSILAAAFLLLSVLALAGCDNRNITPADSYAMARDAFVSAFRRGPFSVFPKAEEATGYNIGISAENDGLYSFSISNTYAADTEMKNSSSDFKIHVGEGDLKYRVEFIGGKGYLSFPEKVDGYIVCENTGATSGGESVTLLDFPRILGEAVLAETVPERITAERATVSVFGEDTECDRYTLALDGEAAARITGTLADSLRSLPVYEFATGTPLFGVSDFFGDDTIAKLADSIEKNGFTSAEASFCQKKGATVKGTLTVSDETYTVIFSADLDTDPEVCAIEGYLSVVENENDEEKARLPFEYSYTEKDGKFDCELKLTAEKIDLPSDDGGTGYGAAKIDGAYIKVSASGEYSADYISAEGEIKVFSSGVGLTFPFDLSAKKDGVEVGFSGKVKYPGASGVDLVFEGKVGQFGYTPGEYDPAEEIDGGDEELVSEWMSRATSGLSGLITPSYGDGSEFSMTMLTSDKLYYSLQGDGTGQSHYTEWSAVREGNDYLIPWEDAEERITLTETTNEVVIGGEVFSVSYHIGDEYFVLENKKGTSIEIQTEESGTVVDIIRYFEYEIADGKITFSFTDGKNEEYSYETEGSRVLIGGERFTSRAVGFSSFSFSLIKNDDPDSDEYYFYDDGTGVATGSFPVEKNGEDVVITLGGERISIAGDIGTVTTASGEEYDIIRTHVSAEETSYWICSVKEAHGEPADMISIYDDGTDVSGLRSQAFTYEKDGDGYIIASPSGDLTLVTRDADGSWLVGGEKFDYEDLSGDLN